MNIEQTLANARSFADLLPLARGATTHLSFWGSRYVCVVGYDGTLDLDALAAKVIELVEKYPNFDEQERVCGKEIARLIDRNIYDAIDIQISGSNCITWLFVILRDVCTVISRFFQFGVNGCMPQGTRWWWRDDTLHPDIVYNRIFDFYTEEQFTKKYGMTSSEAHKRGYQFSSISVSYRAYRCRIVKTPEQALLDNQVLGGQQSGTQTRKYSYS